MTKQPSPRDTIPLSRELDDHDWARAREHGIRIRSTENGRVVACNRIGLTGYGRSAAQALAELDLEIMRNQQHSRSRR